MSRFTEVGNVSKLHGNEGNIRVKIFAPYLQSFNSASFFFINVDGIDIPFTKKNKISSEKGIISIKYVDNIKDAKALLGKKIYLENLIKTKTPKDQHHFLSFIGFQILHKSNNNCGVINSIERISKQYLATVQLSEEKSYLLPISEHNIMSVNSLRKTILMDFPLDLLTLNQ